MEKAKRASKSESYSSDQAEIIWAAAARMQADAEAKLLGEESPPRPLLEEFEIDAAHSTFNQDELKEIADDAGINPDFVELVLLQNKLDQVSPSEEENPLISRLVGFVDNGHVNSETILDYSINEVNSAIQRVFPSNQYALQLVDVIGDGQPGDTILKFKTPPGSASFGRISQIFVTLHPLAENKCQIKFRAEQIYSPRSKGQLMLSIFVGAGISWWPIPAMLGDYGSLAIGLACATTFFAGFLGLLAVTRWDNRKSIRQGKEILEEILQAIRADVKTKGMYASTIKEPI